METLAQPRGRVQDVAEQLMAAQEEAETKATTAVEKAAVAGVFGGLQEALDAHPKDAQATVTAQITTTEHGTKIYVDVTVVPSEAVQIERLAADTAAAATTETAGV